MKKPTEHDTFLRDLFAGLAMNAWLSAPDLTEKSFNAEEVAKFSYSMADAMMEERKK